MNAWPGAEPHRALLERTRELAALGSSLQAAKEGRGTVCLISGEPGIGKSRLISEFAADTQRQGIAVHWGSAWEAGGAPVYWPWIQVLRSLLASSAARSVLERLPHLVPEIAELVPEIAVSEAQRAVRLEPEQARFRLMDTIATWLQAASADAPLIVVMEDAHAADPDSIVLLEFVARQLRTSKTLLLASYRETELHRPRVGNVITRIKREAVQLHLERLGRDSVREYIRSATGERPLEQTVAEIFKLTEGHPLYLKEVVELGIARGSFRTIPTTLALAIHERVAELPSETQSLLGVASVFGREVSLASLAELAGQPPENVERDLAPALASRLIEHTEPGRMRFEHVLVREAMHDSLPASRRRELHEHRARHLQSRTHDESAAPWTELAQHFEQSGPEARERALDAWRRAAVQAGARHAFDDAVMCCARALECASSMPGVGPALRAQLLLELATAQIRVGDLDAGRRNSSEAFNLAEKLKDMPLMADAALAYGGVFTFGSVDNRLVQLLRKAFDALGDENPRRRARVLGRLAAAMQPAANPLEPIDMAREAIRLARTTGDQRTLLNTLRSAISAMMDLGNPVERMQLNREYVALAGMLDDTSEVMRGYTRLVIDAIELGDATTMDHAIDQCGALAHALALPHYQWTAATFRVMQAILRGNVNVAAATLEQAEHFAQRSQDPNAVRTLAVQRVAITELRGLKDEMKAAIQHLEHVFSDLPHADTYLRAYLLATLVRCGETPPADSVDAEYVRKVLQFRDLGAVASLAEYLAACGERELQTQVYEFIQPHRAHCAHWGLLGMYWQGPASRSMALLAAALGRTADANMHFADALEIARRMGAKPSMDRITAEWNALRRRTEAAAALAGVREADVPTGPGAYGPAGPGAIPAAHGRGVPAVAYFRLSREGDVWACECDGKHFRLRDGRGLQMLARLVEVPAREIHVLDLAGAGAGGASAGESPVDLGDSGELLDERARRDYRRRIEELRIQIEEAEETGDAAAAESAREELEHLTGELARAFGLAGRARKAGSAVERARVNVQRRLKDAQTRIAKECPTAGRHLEWALRTGLFCSYRPG